MASRRKSVMWISGYVLSILSAGALLGWFAYFIAVPLVVFHVSPSHINWGVVAGLTAVSMIVVTAGAGLMRNRRLVATTLILAGLASVISGLKSGDLDTIHRFASQI